MEMTKDTLFCIKSKKSGKIYDTNRSDLYDFLEELGLNIFRPHDVLLSSCGEVIIVNTVDDIEYINPDDVEIIWNKNHRLYKGELKK